jgi:uncharacterized protein YcbX
MPRATLAALNVYPVKGCRGIAVPRARASARGLLAVAGAAAVGDREFMIVDPAGRFVTQREEPRLALIATRLESNALVLAARGAPPLVIALGAPRGAARQVTVWRSEVIASDAGDAAAFWLATVLGSDLRLVRFDPRETRFCNPEYAGDSGAHVAFADGYPVLAIAEASLGDLNTRLAATGAAALSMNRFRPNVVVAGLEAYDEDHVDTIAADGVTLKLVKPCTRCQVTTTDQDTAAVGDEPLATLARYRMNAALGGVTFGMNAIVVVGEGRELAVGGDLDCRFAF